jgi:hypothetical protein
LEEFATIVARSSTSVVTQVKRAGRIARVVQIADISPIFSSFRGTIPD